MDSDEAFHVKALFYQGSYSACHSAVAALDSPSPRIVLYAARSLIALRQPSKALELLAPLPQDDSATKAVKLLADYSAAASPSSAEFAEQAEALADEIADDEGDGPDAVLRVSIATVLHLCDNTPLAVFLLKQGAQVKSLESVALLVHLYLSPSLRRPDLARNLYAQAKAWADDAILLQMCEAWIGVVTGSVNGKEPGGYQAAYYVFDETAQLSGGSTSVAALNGKAVAQGAMGHWEEAQGNIGEASQIASNDDSTLANQMTVNLHLGQQGSNDALTEQLRSANPSHPWLQALDKQSTLFDEAASKFAVAKA